MWHFFQGWWYRTLVDAKVYEVKKACGLNKIHETQITESMRMELINYLKQMYNINLDSASTGGGR